MRPRDRRIVEETRNHALGTLEERTDDPQYYLDRALPPERANTDREYND